MVTQRRRVEEAERARRQLLQDYDDLAEQHRVAQGALGRLQQECDEAPAPFPPTASAPSLRAHLPRAYATSAGLFFLGGWRIFASRARIWTRKGQIGQASIVQGGI